MSEAKVYYNLIQPKLTDVPFGLTDVLSELINQKIAINKSWYF